MIGQVQLDRRSLIFVHELFGATNDFVCRPPVLAGLQVEDITNLVASAENEVDIVLGVCRREAESYSRRDQGGGTARTTFGQLGKVWLESQHGLTGKPPPPRRPVFDPCQHAPTSFGKRRASCPDGTKRAARSASPGVR